MSDADLIKARRQEFLAAFAEEDIPAMTEYVTADHRSMPPNQPRVVGHAGASAFWAEAFAAVETVMSTSSHELSVAGDIAVDRFEWQQRITPRGEGQTLQDKGCCVWIWRREDDGAWRIQTAIWNSDLAEPGIWSGG